MREIWKFLRRSRFDILKFNFESKNSIENVPCSFSSLPQYSIPTLVTSICRERGAIAQAPSQKKVRADVTILFQLSFALVDLQKLQIMLEGWINTCNERKISFEILQRLDIANHLLLKVSTIVAWGLKNFYTWNVMIQVSNYSIVQSDWFQIIIISTGRNLFAFKIFFWQHFTSSLFSSQSDSLL